MNQSTLWNSISQPQSYNFPIWAVLESHSTYTVELLRESSALNLTKIKAWMPAQVPEPPKERWQELADKRNPDGIALSALNTTYPLSGMIYNASVWENVVIDAINAIDKSFWNTDKDYPVDSTNSKQNT